MASNKGTTWETKGAKSFVDAYKLYSSREPNPVSKKKFKDVIESCNEGFMNLLVEEGRVLRMPYLSKIQVIKTQKPSKAHIDYKIFNETGEVRPYDNLHSDGYRAKLHWSKRAFPIVGISPYSIKMSEVLRKKIASEMKKIKGHTKYPELNYGK